MHGSMFDEYGGSCTCTHVCFAKISFKDYRDCFAWCVDVNTYLHLNLTFKIKNI